MKAFHFIFALPFLFQIQISFAQTECVEFRRPEVYPIRQTIYANSAFLIDFSEKYYKLKPKVKDLRFMATSSSGKKYKLRVLESNFSGSMGQLLLRPKDDFTIGDSITIGITFKNGDSLSGTPKELDTYIGYQKWVVKYEADHGRPKFKSSDNGFHFFRYYKGVAVEFEGFGILDDSQQVQAKVKDYTNLVVYYCIELRGERFLSTADHHTPRLFNGPCNGNFTFGYEQPYSAKVRVVDASGNFSRKSVRLDFRTPPDVAPDPNGGG